MKERAYFFFEPRRIDDLTPSNPKGKWMEYRIVKTICLSRIDYGNFTTDLLADRQFIEDNISLCQAKGDCLLVTDRQHSSELLVIPWHGCYVRYAACMPPIHLLQLETKPC